VSDSRHQGIGMTSQRTRNRLIDRLREQGIRNEEVLRVIAETPRHLFVDEALSHRAYEDTALPIGHGQTISQPYIVARMTELLIEDNRPSRVLELGTGSGYQTAVLAKIVSEVFTVERIAALLDQAQRRFRTLGLKSIRHRHDDGHIGWADRGPFDGILCTASPAEIPLPLIDQLSMGGRLVTPVGREEQSLHVITRTEEGYDEVVIEPVRFVPLLGGRK